MFDGKALVDQAVARSRRRGWLVSLACTAFSTTVGFVGYTLGLSGPLLVVGILGVGNMAMQVWHTVEDRRYRRLHPPSEHYVLSDDTGTVLSVHTTKGRALARASSLLIFFKDYPTVALHWIAADPPPAVGDSISMTGSVEWLKPEDFPGA